jgi:predicted dehydrogenase
MSRRNARRHFLKAGALTGVGVWAGNALSAQEQQPARPAANDRLNVAIIGAGGQGGGNLRNIARTENIVALCDVDDSRAGASYEAFPRAERFSDFRQMLDRRRDIDAVVVSTPDHQHAIASIMAMRLGKHCYCEKPLTHDVWEARQMREVALRYGVATQMGNMGTASNRFREGVELIRSGALGPVREVHVWTNRPGTYWRQGMTEAAPEQQVPNTLHWDLWLGTAPQRSYNSAYVPFHWRGWWDFGTGAIGDMACHTMNLPYMALNLGAPTAVSANPRQPVSSQSPPNGCTVLFEFPERRVPSGGGRAHAEVLPAVRLSWYEGGYPNRDLFRGALAQGQNPNGSGFLVIGERGTMYSPHDYGGTWRLLPEDQFRNAQPPAPTLQRAPAPIGQGRNTQSPHHAEWLRACKSGPAAMSNFVDYAGPFTETVLLGNIALRVGVRIEWDPRNLRVTNNQDANRFVRREYRRGWEIPT